MTKAERRLLFAVADALLAGRRPNTAEIHDVDCALARIRHAESVERDARIMRASALDEPQPSSRKKITQ